MHSDAHCHRTTTLTHFHIHTHTQAPAVGWHLEHDLELIPEPAKEGGFAVVAKPKASGKSGKQAAKQRRTNKGGNKGTR